MRILIIGCGLVGQALARELKQSGHEVVGTTTSPDKVAKLQEVCDEVRVLRGHEREGVHEASKGCQAIVVCAGPSAKQAMTPEQRKKTYHQILVETAESAASAPIDGPVISLSSLTVYGDAADHLDYVDESAPLTDSLDASPASFRAAEDTYRQSAPDRHVIFRCADITGGEDLPIEMKLRMAHEYFGGHVPFQDGARFYRIHQQDVVMAIKHAIDTGLVGTFNLTHEEVPPRNDEFFGAVCDIEGLPHLTFRNELKGPGKPVSVQRLLDTGFKLEHTQAEQLPATAG